MPLVTTGSPSARRSAVLVDGAVVDLAALLGRTSFRAVEREIRPSLNRQLLEADADVQDEVEGLAREEAAAAGEYVREASTVRLGPPVPDPEKIICLGLNYMEHAEEANMAVPEVPAFFSRFANSLAGPTDSIELIGESEQVDYEGELAVVIGRTARRVSAETALEHVAGYAVFNDVSARDLQMRTSQWLPGKIQDGYAPMGPMISVAEVPDPQDLQIRTVLNGRLVQDGSTAGMVFSVSEAIAHLSTLLTLRPGDVIATGTPAGVVFGSENPDYMTAGDVVEIEIDGLGTVRNEFVSAPGGELGR